MFTIPKTEKAIKARIKSYEKSLQDEKRKFGAINDGYGKRYLLGPLYLVMNDLEGALQSFAWFETEFGDDSGDPFQYLCWILALYKVGMFEEAEKKVAETVLQNPYLIPKILGEPVEAYDIWHFSNLVEIEYVQYLPSEFEALWDETALAWLSNVYHSEKIQKILAEFVDIYRQLKTEPVGPKRTSLVRRSHGLLKEKFGEE